MKWNHQVDALTLECLISVHHQRSELNKKSSKEKEHFLQKTGFTVMKKMIQIPQWSRHYVNTQVVPWLLKGYGRGNHRPSFGLPVLAYQQSERALSSGFSFVLGNDLRLAIEYKGFCFLVRREWS